MNTSCLDRDGHTRCYHSQRRRPACIKQNVLAAVGRSSRVSRWEARCCLDKIDKIIVVLVRSPSAPCRSSGNSIRAGRGGVHSFDPGTERPKQAAGSLTLRPAWWGHCPALGPQIRQNVKIGSPDSLAVPRPARAA